MKICHVYDDFISPAKDSMGAERVCESITNGYLKLGHEVVMKIHPSSTNSVAPIVSEVPDDVDIIHYHQWQPGKIDYNKYNKPWVATLHGGGSETDPTIINSITNCPNIICVSEHIAKIFNLKAWVWACSNVEDFTFRQDKEDYFLWMAGTDWGEGKGLWSTIQLAKKMRFNLKIAGSGQNKDTIEKIKSLCDDKITYIGSVNGKEKADVLSRAKALILLTRLNDACPTTVSEAMLSGTPVIASNNGAMPEIVLQGKTGYICANDVDFYRAIFNIDKIDPKICRKIGEEMFSSEEAAKKYLQYYDNMIKFGKVSP